MSAEQSEPIQPHLDSIARTFHTEQQEQERRRLLGEFAKKAEGLIWSYSPAVKQKAYSWKYAYPYLEPGTARTPNVSIQTPEGRIRTHIEGEYVEDTTPHVHPDSVKTKRLDLHFRKGKETSSLIVDYDGEGNPVEDTMPLADDLRKGLEVLDYMSDYYVESGIKQAPRGFDNDIHY